MTVASVDRTALESKVKSMYSAVAANPQGEFHFEMGRVMAERLGYAAADLDRIPPLPEDVEPLRNAVRGITDGTLDVVLFTTSVQIVHLTEVADTLGAADSMRDGLRRMAVASIGPTCTEALRNHGVAVDLEASHPKMGFLVREAAERAPELLRVKRRTS